MVPKRPSVDVYSLFQLKWRCSSRQIVLMKPPKWPLSIFLSTGVNHKIIGKKGWCVRRKKLEADLTQKKVFFDFLCWDDLRVFFTAKNFLKKIFFEFFYQIDLQFFAPHWSAFNPTGFILARLYWKCFAVILVVCSKKIVEGKTFI